jgi:serine/threonine protein kinase
MRQLLNAIRELQDMGVAHRDIKSPNILMIRREGEDENDFNIKVGLVVRFRAFKRSAVRRFMYKITWSSWHTRLPINPTHAIGHTSHRQEALNLTRGWLHHVCVSADDRLWSGDRPL